MPSFFIRTALSRFSVMASKQNSTKNSTTMSILSDVEREMIDRVHSHFPNHEPNQFHFFYETASPFSNFHPCTFQENGITFDCSEKYMMYEKAKLFGDDETAQAILDATTPADCKSLGRTVKNFDSDRWIENRTPIVSKGLMMKFTQDERMKEALFKHYGSLLVEAAPHDAIWGVGLSKDNPRITNRSNWKGLNLLGYILTDILQRTYPSSS